MYLEKNIDLKKSEGNYSSYALNEEIYFSLADTLDHFSLDRALLVAVQFYQIFFEALILFLSKKPKD